MTPADIINRCTRNGVTSWQHVARQMGRSLDAVRSQYDPHYLKVRPWPHPCEVVPREVEIDEDDTRSPYAKPIPLKSRILLVLGKHSLSAQTVASVVGTTLGCAKKELSALKRAGLIQHTRRYPYTWSLVVTTGLRPGNSSVAGEAA